MREASSSSGGSSARLLRVIGKHWPWIFIVAALLLVLVWFMPAVYLAGICSDNVQGAVFFHDVFELGNPARGWVFGGHSDLVPDVSLIFLLQWLLHDGLLALQIQNALFFAGWVAAVTALYRVCGGRNAAVFAGIVTLLLMGCCRNFGANHGLAFYDMFAMGTHSGTDLMAFVCVALSLRAAGAGRGYGVVWWLAAFCFLAAASDALFLILFPIPALAALAVARWRYPTQIRFAPVAVSVVLSTAVGFVLGPRIFPGIVGGYTHFDAAAARHAWAVVVGSCSPSAGGDFVFFFVLDLVAMIAGAMLVVGPLARVAAGKFPPAIYLLLLYLGCVIAVDWGAAVLTGDLVSLAASRYVRYSILFPVFAMLGWINHGIPWSKHTAGSVAAALSVVIAFFAIYGRPAPDLYYDEVQILTPIVRSVMEKEHIEAGLADYWYANVFNFLSGDRMHFRAVVRDGSIFHWLNNIVWYTGMPPKTPTPKFRMILTANLDPQLLRQRYGPPERIIPVVPGQELWIYPEDRAITFNAVFGELTNDPAYSSSTEYRIPAALLPSQTGARDGDSITARAGRDKEGPLTYGPYIHPGPGRYRIEIAYAWLAAPAPGKEASLDAILWNGTKPDTLAQGEIPYAGSDAPQTFTREIRIPGGDRGTFEARVFYHAAGDLRIDSLRIVFLGP